MTWTPLTARYSDRALKDLRRLDGRLVDRIRRGVRRYAESGEGDVKKLRGRDDEYRLRIGDWRVLFERDGGELVILVLHIAPRGDAYK